MRRANVQLQSDRRAEILDGGAALLRALRLPPGLDAGDLRRSRHEPRQSLPLLPLQGSDHRRHRRARPRRGGAAIRQRRSRRRTSSPPSRRSRATTSSSAPTRRWRCAPRSWPRAAAIRRSRASSGFDADVRRLDRPCCAPPPSAATFRRDIDFDGVVSMLMIIADGVWWRRAVDPEFDAERCCRSSWTSRATCCAPAARERHAQGGRSPMKASRITAVGLVAAAAAWIASGYLLPHENGESRAAIRRRGRKAQKLFRVAVAETTVAPHSRKLVLSGRTEADRKVMAGRAHRRRAHRAAGPPRRRACSKGDVIAVLSDEAREAQVAQARALLDAAQGRARRQAAADRERHDAAARSRQSRSAVQGRRGRRLPPPRPSATAASCARPGPASSPT